MIERTQRRLGQARFFYQHLLNERQQTFRHDPGAFGYYLSAFIQAARSVTWTLGNEQPDKWKAWEPRWKASLTTDEQKLLDITNKFRIDEVKRGGADLTVDFEEVAIDELLKANLDLRRQHPAYGLYYWTRPPGVPPPKTQRPAYYLEDKNGKLEITEVCERYLKFLEKTINDFIREYEP